MNILGIIPARKGSTRIKDKNIKKLGGKPLVKFAIDNALNSKLIDKIVVSTNSAEVLEMDRDYSERVFFLKRPEAISGDKSPSIDFVNHVLDHEEHNNQIYDIIVILQPTSPLTSPNDIDNTINLLINSDADSAVSVVRLAHDVNPIKMKIFNGSKLIPYLEDEGDRMSNDQIPDVYVRNGSVYCSRINTIKSGKIIGERCLGYIMPRSRSVDINDELDFEFAEFLYVRGFGSN